MSLRPSEAKRIAADVRNAFPDIAEARAVWRKMALERVQSAGILSKVGAAKDLKKGCEADQAAYPSDWGATKCFALFHKVAPGIVGGDEKKVPALMARLKTQNEAEYIYMVATSEAELNPEDRLNLIDQALEISPTSEMALTATLYSIRSEEYERAYRYISVGLDLDVDSRMLTYQMGKLAAVSGTHLAEGAAALRSFINGPSKIGGQDFRAHAHWRLGVVLEKLDRSEEAKKIAKRALTLKPSKKLKKDLRALIASL